MNSTVGQTIDLNGTRNGSEITTIPVPYRGELGYGPFELIPEFMAGYYIWLYYLWIIAAIGVPGNILSIVTICRMGPITPSSLYICVLAVTDNFAITAKILYLQLTLNDVKIGPFGCKLVVFSTYLWSIFANWVLVTMTSERYIAVCFPLKFRAMCTKKIAMIKLSVIFVFTFGLYSHIFETMTDIYHPVRREHCDYHSDSTTHFWVFKIWYWIDAAIYAVIPCAIIVFLNVMIILGINKSHRQKEQLSSRSDQQVRSDKEQQRQITTMMLALSILFVVLTAPHATWYVMETFWDYNVSLQSYSHYILGASIIHLWSDANHAVNFLLYFLSGKKFRAKFLELVSCGRFKSRKSVYGSTNVSAMSETEISTVSTRDYPMKTERV